MYWVSVFIYNLPSRQKLVCLLTSGIFSATKYKIYIHQCNENINPKNKYISFFDIYLIIFETICFANTQTLTQKISNIQGCFIKK